MPQTQQAGTAATLHAHQFHLDANNITRQERLTTGFGGAAVLLMGIGRALRSPVSGLPMAFLGASAIARAVSGRSRLYRKLGVQTPSSDSPLAERMPNAIVVEHVVTINCPADKLFREWSKLENLPTFMHNIVSVAQLSATRARWIAEGPGNRRLEWETEVEFNKREKLIAWKSLPGGDVPQEGFVYFEPAPGGRGTEMTFQLAYTMTGGRLSMLLGRVSGADPSQHIREALRRFKARMEAGEVPTTEGQPTGVLPQATEISRKEAA